MSFYFQLGTRSPRLHVLSVGFSFVSRMGCMLNCSQYGASLTSLSSSCSGYEEVDETAASSQVPDWSSEQHLSASRRAITSLASLTTEETQRSAAFSPDCLRSQNRHYHPFCLKHDADASSCPLITHRP